MRLNKLLVIVFATNFLFGCADELIKVNDEGSEISFKIDRAKTRTSYKTETDTPGDIVWDIEDKISIFCEQSVPVVNADYSVLEDENYSLYLSSNGGGLCWSGTWNTHHFYATYPANSASFSKNDEEKIIATFEVPTNQTCEYISGYNTVQFLKPDMNNAIMMAYTSSLAPTPNVHLAFKPIMTTLNITLNGPEQARADNGDPLSTYTRITGLNVKCKGAKVSNTFQYDITEGEKGALVPTQNALNELSINVGILNNDMEKNRTYKYFDLRDNQSVKIMVFLPPISITSESELQISVIGATKDDVDVATLKFNASQSGIDASAIANVTLPAVTMTGIGTSDSVSSNDWQNSEGMNQLFVRDLLLPGSHNSAAHAGVSGIGDNFTQEMDIDKQWNLGVRCFDFGIGVESEYRWTRKDGSWTKYYWVLEEKLLNVYLGDLKLASFEETLNNIVTKASDSNEFAVVLLRYDNIECATLPEEGSIWNPYVTIKEDDDDAYSEIIASWITENSSNIVAWNANLTVEQCKGKIILMAQSAPSAEYTWPGVAVFEDWPVTAIPNSSTLASHQVNVNVGSNAAGKCFVQNYTPEDSQNLLNKHLSIQNMISRSTTSDNNWYINYISTSGNTPTMMSNAQSLNSAALTNLRSNTLTQESRTITPSGIMFVDFIGTDSYKAEDGWWIFTQTTNFALQGQALLTEMLEINNIKKNDTTN